MFLQLKTAVAANFAALVKHGIVFVVDYDRDKIWEAYLNAFSDATRQEHNCNCCKAFIRQIGGAVVILPDNQLFSLWDLPLDKLPDEFKASVKALAAYVHSRPVHGLFSFEPEPMKNGKGGFVQPKPGPVGAGTDKNFSEKHNVIFQHFFVTIPKELRNLVVGNPSTSGTLRTNKQVFLRGLTELTPDSFEQVLELIDTKSLYKGSEFKHILEGFLKVQKEFTKIPKYLQDNFCWRNISTLSPSVTLVRNHSIGQLLIDLSEGRDLDSAVTSFEKIVAPANYKRTSAVVSPRMIEDAKKKLASLGLIGALNRRILDSKDLGPHNALFVYRPQGVTKDVFTELVADVPVKKPSLTKIEEITIVDFLENVLPKAKTIRAFIEPQHIPNLATLTGPVDKDEPSLMNWDNSFGWSYKGGVADGLREKVAALGGRVDGVFRFSHTWNYDGKNQSLMDLHVSLPGAQWNSKPKELSCGYAKGRRIGWNSRKDESSGGNQDVDFVEAPNAAVPVENITFPDIKRMPEGTYICKVHNWRYRSPSTSGFKAEIECGGQLYQYHYAPGVKNQEWITVAEVELKQKEFTVKHILPPADHEVTQWGVTTGKWKLVTEILLSPNHWNKPVGHKHWFFILDGCKAEEAPRPFYNEFLCPALHENRKVMEVLASKIQIAPAEGRELSGLGFSETVRNHLVVEVEGAIKRTLKVLF